MPSPSNYASHDVTSLSDFEEAIKLFSKDWVFRGQSDGTWHIQTSLERDLWQDDNYAAFERHSLDEIKKFDLEPYGESPPGDDFSWLAFLQHRGCPTRMVDFTRCPEIALYFALAGFRKKPTSPLGNPRPTPVPPSGDFAAIWACDRSVLDEKLKALASEGSKSANGSPADQARDIVNASIKDPSEVSHGLPIICAEPPEGDIRRHAQKGLFLIPLDLSRIFHLNLLAGLGLSVSKTPKKRLHDLQQLEEALAGHAVIKLRINKQASKEFLSHLARKEITDKEMFPGLDGFARSLSIRHAASASNCPSCPSFG